MSLSNTSRSFAGHGGDTASLPAVAGLADGPADNQSDNVRQVPPPGIELSH